MSVFVLVDASVKPEQLAGFKAYMTELLPSARAYEGCRVFDVYYDTEDKTRMIVFEQWDSRQHHEKYLAWRTETGVIDKIMGMLTGPPSFRYFDRG